MDKELIEHIATQLHSHEEAYAEGAWERFSEKKKRRGIVYWPMWAAAILVLTAGAVFYGLNQNTTPVDIAKTQTKTHSNHSNQAAGADVKLNTETQINNGEVNNGQKPVLQSNAVVKNSPVVTNDVTNPFTPATQVISTTNNPILIAAQPQLSGQLYNPSISSASSHRFELAVAQKKPKPSKMTFEDLLAQDSKTNQFANNTKSNQDSKWQPGVYVAPSMGNDNKLNMNYGFSLSYAIANKVSISSGVSYSSISSKEVLGADVPQTLSGRNLESVNARVEGINVPLELKYNISDKLYTGIGVSALAVTNNRQENTYISNQVQNAAALNSATGSYDAKTLIVAERKVEPQPEATIDPDRYIGFYNFSFGYKQKLSPKKNIAIEPFLRVPMKTFSKENLNLTNGGLRIKVDF